MLDWSAVFRIINLETGMSYLDIPKLSVVQTLAILRSLKPKEEGEYVPLVEQRRIVATLRKKLGVGGPQ